MVHRRLADGLEGLENPTAVTQNLLRSPLGLGQEVNPLSPEQPWPESGGSSVLRDSVLSAGIRQLEEPWPWGYLPIQFPITLY